MAVKLVEVTLFPIIPKIGNY